MKKIMSLVALFFAGNAFAGFEHALYSGTLENGTTCMLAIQSVEYVGGVAHPLNERVTMSFDSEAFTLSHLPLIDEAKGTVRAEGSYLKGAKGTATESIALSVKMIHSAEYHGPAEATLIRYNSKNPALSSKAVCKNIGPVIIGQPL